jgi:dTDP-4-amino-4,6-dideoxygalactose transaminase
LFQLKPPLKIDFKFSDLTSLWQRGIEKRVEVSDGKVAIAYSVRTIWLTLLESLGLKAGDEIILSAINIPDMFEIVQLLKLKAIIVDIDSKTLVPELGDLKKAITIRTKVVLISHLFGSWSNLHDYADLCHEREILLVEDCAQCFMGSGFGGTTSADVSLFSLGFIKRSTALGGSIGIVRSSRVPNKFWQALEHYPTQPFNQFSLRVLKALGFLVLKYGYSYSILCWLLKHFKDEPHDILREWVRGFRHKQSTDLSQFRINPHPWHVRLICHKWMGPFPRRSEESWEFVSKLRTTYRNADIIFPGLGSEIHSFWLFPVRAKNPGSLARKMRQHGFGVTRGLTSLKCLGGEATGTGHKLLEQVVYLSMGLRSDASFFTDLQKQLALIPERELSDD